MTAAFKNCKVGTIFTSGITVCAVLMIGILARGETTTLKAVNFSDILHSKWFAPYLPLSVSPDGSWIAFTLIDRSRAAQFEGKTETRYWITPTGAPFQLAGSDIWIANLQTGEGRNLTKGIGINWGPAWSPDGRYVAFRSDRSGRAAAWLWETASGTVKQLSSAQVVDTFGGLQWTPDSKKLAFTVLPEGLNFASWMDGLGYQPEDARNEINSHQTSSDTASVHVVEFSPASKFNKFLCDLAIVDVQTSSLERLVSRVRPLWWRLSPRGSSVAVMSWVGELKPGSAQGIYDLSVTDFETRKSRILASNLRWQVGSPLNWAPDSSSIVFATGGPEASPGVFDVTLAGPRTTQLISDDQKEFRSPTCLLWDDTGQYIYAASDHNIWRVAVSTNALRKIASIPDHDILSMVADLPRDRLWNYDGSSSAILVTRDERTLDEGFFEVNLQTGESKSLDAGSKTLLINDIDYCGSYVSAHNRLLVYVSEDARHPQDIWILDLETSQTRRITELNPQFQTDLLGTPRLIEWRSTDGLNLRGALLLPPEYKPGQSYPLVVCVYGGAYLSSDLNEWNPVACPIHRQFLASHGYVVFLPDSPQRVGTPMGDIAKAVIPGVQKLIDLGIADPERVGVIGISYGGYSTLSLIVQAHLFKAAVSVAGSLNLTDSYVRPGMVGVSIAWAEQGQGKIGGSLWEFRDRFIENSPLFYLDQVETPLLLLHGTADTSPVMQSRLAYGALQRLGKEVSYAEYEGEEHGPDQWSLTNQTDYYQRILAWLDSHLKRRRADSAEN